MKPLTTKSMLAGGIVALVISVLHSQFFRSDLFEWSGLIAWYLVSFLLGCAAGIAAGLLVSRVAGRGNLLVTCLGGALFGIFGYLIQFYVFLLYVFGNTTWE